MDNPKISGPRIPDSTSHNHAVIGFNSLEGVFIGLALKMDSKLSSVCDVAAGTADKELIQVPGTPHIPRFK